MTPRRKLYSVWLDPEHLAALKEVRERDGVLPSEQVRRALEMWFRAKRIAVGKARPKARA